MRLTLFSQHCFEQGSRSTTTSTMDSIELADAAHIIIHATAKRRSSTRLTVTRWSVVGCTTPSYNDAIVATVCTPSSLCGGVYHQRKHTAKFKHHKLINPSSLCTDIKINRQERTVVEMGAGIKIGGS